MKLTHEQMVTRLADRLALVLLSYWAKTGTFAPFDRLDFWQCNDAMEIRTMPEYQEAIDMIRDLLVHDIGHDYLKRTDDGAISNTADLAKSA